MAFKVDILTLIAFLGTFQGIAFSIIFWVKNKSISNRIFSLFLLATSIRIAKNIFVHLRELNPDMFTMYDLWRTSVYVGISHQMAIGPLLLLYFQSKLTSKFRWKRIYLWHFTPYFLFVLISPFTNWNFWQYGGLWLSYISILVYYLWTVGTFYKGYKTVDYGTLLWLRSILLIIGGLLIAYSPMLFHYIGYVGGAFLYTLAILATGYIMIVNKGTISFFRTKYETSSLSDIKIQKIKDKLKKVMKAEKPFTDPELTIQNLAEKLSVHSHHLSRVINQEFKMSFTDYINAFRLEEATRRLTDQEFAHLKISALAFDCGFNSTPTFNTLFKKVHKVTPSQFRNALQKV